MLAAIGHRVLAQHRALWLKLPHTLSDFPVAPTLQDTSPLSALKSSPLLPLRGDGRITLHPAVSIG
jgi:hypothetical protein